MDCVKVVHTYACANAAGTTCVKQALDVVTKVDMTGVDGPCPGYLMATESQWAPVLAASTAAADSTTTVVVSLNTPVLNLSVEEGAQIAGAILLCWAAGFGIRAVVRALSSGDEPSKESET